MTNALSATLFTIVLVAMGADYLLNDFSATLFLLRKFLVLIEYLAFWR